MDGNAKITLRTAKLADKGFILKSWLMGNYFGDWHFNQMNQDYYYKIYSEHISKILLTPNTTIDVAIMSDAPDMLLGFIVYRGPLIFWAFVKPEYRGQGIFNFMIKDKKINTAASVTKSGSAIIKHKQWTFNPFV